MKIHAITLRIIASLFFIILGLTQAISVHTATDAGGACSVSSDCDSGLCQSSICIGKKIGQACSDDDQCTTGQCENSFCVCDDQDKQKSDHCENTLYGGYGGTASGWKCMDSDQDPDSSRAEWNFCKKADYLQSLPKESTADVKYPVEKKILMGYACDESASCISAGIGEKCNTTNSVSTPDNDPWHSPDKMLRVCTADFDEEATDTIEEVCTKQYGPGDWTVVVGTGELEGLRVCKNTSPNWTPTTLEEMRKYVAPTNNSVQTTFLGFDISTQAPELVTPETKIGIPGVFFTNITKETHITTDEFGASWLNIPFLGEFISAIYKYSVGLISLIAVMVLIISGVQIITSAGNSEAISSAKHRIVSSVIAIVITAGSYTILYTVNPDLVNLKNLKILVVPGKTLDFTPEGDDIPQAVENVGLSEVKALSGANTSIPTDLKTTMNPIPYLIGELPNSIAACSKEAIEYTAQKLAEQNVCLGSCHCAYTASHFLNYAKCNIPYNGSAPKLAGLAETAGWTKVKIDPNKNIKNLPLGLAVLEDSDVKPPTSPIVHVGISLGNGKLFDASDNIAIFEKINKATGNTCPPVNSETKKPLIFDLDPNDNNKNCSGCSRIPSEAPATGRFASPNWTKPGAKYEGSLITGKGGAAMCKGIQFWGIRGLDKYWDYVYVPPSISMP